MSDVSRHSDDYPQRRARRGAHSAPQQSAGQRQQRANGAQPRHGRHAATEQQPASQRKVQPDEQRRPQRKVQQPAQQAAQRQAAQQRPVQQSAQQQAARRQAMQQRGASSRTAQQAEQQRSARQQAAFPQSAQQVPQQRASRQQAARQYSGQPASAAQQAASSRTAQQVPQRAPQQRPVPQRAIPQAGMRDPNAQRPLSYQMQQRSHPAAGFNMPNERGLRGGAASGYRPVTLDAAESRKSKGGPWKVVFVVALVVFIIAAGVLGFFAYSYWSGQNAYDQIAEQAFDAPDDLEGTSLEDMQVDWEALRAINPDIVGWIYIPGTVVNYPIVQTDNDERYLTYDFNGNQGVGATYGTIFLQAANTGDFTDANNIIYGHHMRNGSMFACIAQFTDAAQFNAHRTVYLLTPQGNYKLRTFSLVHCDASDPLAQTTFADDAELTAFAQDKIDRSVVTPEGDIPAAELLDHLFAFITCDSLPTDGRYVLYSYVEDTTVSGQHAAGESQDGEAGTSAVGEETAAAVTDASEELVAA